MAGVRKRKTSGIITLLTDFGEPQAYVGAMKGAILRINPQATIVDISHTVEPQNVAQGAFLLNVAYSSFPDGTIHVAVVDPGVGTERKILLVTTLNAFFLVPDNGLLSYVLDEEKAFQDDNGNPSGEARLSHIANTLRERALGPGVSAVALSNPSYFRHPVSKTFHGRDIFAPAAAHLSLGVPPEEMGDQVSSILAFEVPHPIIQDREIIGHIIYQDSFGNLITDVTQAHLTSPDLVIEVRGHTIYGLSPSYAEGGQLLAVIGSSGKLEIAVRNGSAAKVLGAGVRDLVKITPRSNGP